MIDKIMRIMFYLLFFLTPLIMFPRTSELFEFNKLLYIYASATIIGALWIFKMILQRRIILRKTILFVPIILFLFSQILSTIFSIDQHTSLFGYYGRFNGGLMSTIAYITLYFAMVSNLDWDFMERLLKWSLVSSVVVMLWAIPGKMGHDLSCLLFMGTFTNQCWTEQFDPAARMFSTLGQPNWLGTYIGIQFFIALYFLIKAIRNKSWTRWYVAYILYLILSFVVILFTRSRSSLISVLIGIALLPPILYIIQKRYYKNYLKYLYIPLGIIIVISILLFKSGVSGIDKYITLSTYFHSNQPTKTAVQKAPQQNLIQVNGGVTESFDIRKIVWKGAVELGLKYPLFGTGVETFAYSYYFVRPQEHNKTSEWDFLYNKAHNEYLNYFATTGFVGLITYLLYIGFSVFVLMKIIFGNMQAKIEQLKAEHTKNKPSEVELLVKQLKDKQLLSVCLFLAYIVILITNFVGFSTTTISLAFFLIPGFVLLPLHNFEEEKRVALKKTTKTYLMLGVTTLFAIYLLVSIVVYFLADIEYATGSGYAQAQEYQEAFTYLESAMNLRHEHVYEDKMSYVLANLAYIAAYQKDQDLTKRFATLAEAYNVRTLRESPENVLYWKTRAKNEYLFYQMSMNTQYIEEGIRSLNKAAQYSPTDPKIPYSIALFYSIIADSEKDPKVKAEDQDFSIKFIDKAIGLKPDYRDSYLLRGQLLKAFGRNDEAKQTFEYILKYFDPNDADAKKELQGL